MSKCIAVIGGGIIGLATAYKLQMKYPNAVFAFKRDGYTNKDFSFRDIVDSITYPGFLKFIANNFVFSRSELNSSLFKSVFLKKAKKLIPDINESMF